MDQDIEILNINRTYYAEKLIGYVNLFVFNRKDIVFVCANVKYNI